MINTIRIPIAIALFLCFFQHLTAQHKLGLSYIPFVEKNTARVIYSPVSGSLNYESKELGRFSFRADVDFNYMQYKADFTYYNSIFHYSENNSFSLSYSEPFIDDDLDYISQWHFGTGFDTKFRLSSSNSPHGLYFFGGFNVNILSDTKYHFENGFASNFHLNYSKFRYTKFGVGYSYKLNQLVIVYAEPIVICRSSVGIWRFGIKTGVTFNLGK